MNDIIPNEQSNIIIYNTIDGKAAVALYAKDGKIWLNQKQLAELFATSVPNINMHISNILKDGELGEDSVIKDYLITATNTRDLDYLFNSACKNFGMFSCIHADKGNLLGFACLSLSKSIVSTRAFFL